VNQSYLDCIDSGQSVCRCEEKNKFLICHLVSDSNRLLIHPSIYYSWEPVQLEIQKGKAHQYTVLPSPEREMGSGGRLLIQGSQLRFTVNNKTTLFTQGKFRRLERSLEIDMGRQLSIINCKPLQKYTLLACPNSSTVLLSQSELARLMARGEVSINCSDDYHYTELVVRGTSAQYFMDYRSDTIKLYRLPTRNRGEKVDKSALKDCQIYVKKYPN